MKLSRLLEGIAAEYFGIDPDTDVKDVTENSGDCKNALYFAMRGEKHDGLKYSKEAVKNGCAAVISDRLPDCTDRYILTDNIRAAHAKATANQRGNPQNKLKIIAVTGTNGKTTTTHMLYRILCSVNGISSAALCGGVADIINGIGYPSEQTTPSVKILYSLMDRAVQSGAEYFVCEASSHALAYEKFAPCKIKLGVFTNFTEDHLDFHGTMEKYFRAKCLLIPLCEDFLYNADDKALVSLPGRNFSMSNGDFTAENVTENADGINFYYKGLTQARIQLPVFGMFNAYNALCALSAADILGVSAELSAKALYGFRPAEGRFQIIGLMNGAKAIIDFAHTPSALENALKAARKLGTGKLWCLFGCGGDRDRLKRAQMGRIASKYADFTVITSDNSRSEEPEEIIKDIMRGIDKESRYIKVVNRKDAIIYALQNCQKSDVILLAGKGHEDYEINAAGKHAFSEKEIIRNYEKQHYNDN